MKMLLFEFFMVEFDTLEETKDFKFYIYHRL